MWLKFYNMGLRLFCFIYFINWRGLRKLGNIYYYRVFVILWLLINLSQTIFLWFFLFWYDRIEIRGFRRGIRISFLFNLFLSCSYIMDICFRFYIDEILHLSENCIFGRWCTSYLYYSSCFILRNNLKSASLFPYFTYRRSKTTIKIHCIQSLISCLKHRLPWCIKFALCMSQFEKGVFFAHLGL
jgi:hypothetical protein